MSETNNAELHEHKVIEVEGFRVVDATSSTYPIHDNLIWVGQGTHGRWITIDQATKLAKAILDITDNNLARRQRAASK